MNPLLIADLLAKFGVPALSLVQKLLADVEAGRTATTVTAADIAELDRLSKLTAEDILARRGITLSQ